MSTHTADFGYTTGQTLTAKLFAKSAPAAVVATADSVAEVTDDDDTPSGRFAAVFTDVSGGSYQLRYYLSGTPAGSEDFNFAGVDGEYAYPESEQSKSDIATAVRGELNTGDTTGLGENLANAVDALRSGAGEHAVTITIEDASDNVLQGARVSIVGTTLKQTTGSSGQVTFNLDTASYTVRVSAPSGYVDPDDTAVTVGGEESVAITVASGGVEDYPAASKGM